VTSGTEVDGVAAESASGMVKAAGV
jgi:hypothetical protein